MLATIFRTSAGRPQQQLSTAVQYNFASLRAFQSSTLNAAIAHPVTAHGPPPKAPSPSVGLEKRTTQQSNTDIFHEREPQLRPNKSATVLKKRFWKDVDVKQKDGDFSFLCK
jgi:ATP synthase F1 complex assembly factor 2